MALITENFDKLEYRIIKKTYDNCIFKTAWFRGYTKEEIMERATFHATEGDIEQVIVEARGNVYCIDKH